ncbi:MAG: NAD-dependent epimerase/dehydratase family protein [Nevskiaceae bacterium]|nr:MAG: NAD-dependent epimerase/dehydratase family protein [Nevskiaceae bacterium]TAM32753.1 MAG: NAD-dependent epimerase/dehydratase family protein [Nevskiaceae bacterium]
MPRDTALTALVAGPTGAVGQALLKQLLADPRYARVKALSRRPLGLQHPKLEELRFDGESLAGLDGALAADEVYCCLGTTQKQAGSKAAFERVDYHLVLAVARAARAQGAKKFLAVSAVGASLRSPSFYSRVKARTEQALREVGFEALYIVRPSLLIAHRDELRPAEWLAMQIAPLLNPLLKGDLARYRAVPVEAVAAAMIALASREVAGASVHHLPLAD